MTIKTKFQIFLLPHCEEFIKLTQESLDKSSIPKASRKICKMMTAKYTYQQTSFLGSAYIYIYIQLLTKYFHVYIS